LSSPTIELGDAACSATATALPMSSLAGEPDICCPRLGGSGSPTRNEADLGKMKSGHAPDRRQQCALAVHHHPNGYG
jgi:hypothetical protein